MDEEEQSDLHFKNLFHCEKCPAKFILKHDLKRHMWTHAEIGVSSCNICQKIFSHKNKVEEHMKKQLFNHFVEYAELKVLKDGGKEGRLILSKHNQNFIFQVF